jgi:SNF2 family DNA or RNA helicase
MHISRGILCAPASCAWQSLHCRSALIQAEGCADFPEDATTSHGKENQAAEPLTASTMMMKFKKQSILSRINVSSFQSSTKLEALREEINGMLMRDPAAKCIVFSQFTSMLDLIHFRLNQVRTHLLRFRSRLISAC